MKVLFAAAEAAPFMKTGGLADVAHALPKALNAKGEDVRVVMPLYGLIHDVYKEQMELVGETSVRLNWRDQYVGVYSLVHDGTVFYFIDNEYYFKRDSLYGHYDDGERFSYFAKAILALPALLDFKPDLIHANDWHTGAVPLLLHDYKKTDPSFRGIRTLYTIHNLKYQGIFDHSVLTDLLDLNMSYFHEDGVAFHGHINFMKAGIVYADHVSTVSETYAHEIQFPFFGEGLDGLLRHHAHKLSGIVNGIDYDIYYPFRDEHLYVNYDARCVKRKNENKTFLQDRLRLPVNPDVPMIAMVTRLADMKGLDLIRHILDELLQLDVQFVLLGTGEKEYENYFREYESYFPDKLSANIYFDNDLAHKIYAASDLFLMPSLYEPCGLGQLIALRYGSIPVVRETGGLKDTVIPYNAFTGEGNGFGFKNYNAHELLFKIKDALALYEDQKSWNRFVRQAMRFDYSWEQSGGQYLTLYRSIIN